MIYFSLLEYSLKGATVFNAMPKKKNLFICVAFYLNYRLLLNSWALLGNIVLNLDWIYMGYTETTETIAYNEWFPLKNNKSVYFSSYPLTIDTNLSKNG